MNEIKPFGWVHRRCVDDMKEYVAEGKNSQVPVWAMREFDINVPLYDQSAIDALQAEVRRATSAVESKAGWEWKSRAERAEAAVERLKELCSRMVPVFEAARPLVLTLEELKRAAMKEQS